jgi:hypothetical protein
LCSGEFLEAFPPSVAHAVVTQFLKQVLAALADNAKHNQTGQVDEHGALRHRLPELCGVGALALLFFAHFHVLGQPVPNFAPKFEAPDAGQFGVREWYRYHVFWPTRKSPLSQLTYESELYCDSPHKCPSHIVCQTIVIE